MNCLKCKGMGTERRGKKIVDCRDCKRAGIAVYMTAGGVQAGKEAYKVGDAIGYTNTQKRKCLCRITGFEVSMAFFSNNDGYPVHYYPLKDVLFTGVDTVTGAEVCRPLWRSIRLKKKNELFDTCIVERR